MAEKNKIGKMKYKLEAKNIDVFYGKLKALNNINIGITENAVTALIGPSGCGKSTFYDYLIE